jgi:hypothetical protein
MPSPYPPPPSGMPAPFMPPSPPAAPSTTAWVAQLAASPAWAALDGTLAAVSLGSDGAMWGTAADGQIYRRASATAPWECVPGAAVQVDAQNYSSAVAVNAADDLYQFVGGNWAQMAGAKATCASIGADGTIWAVNRACVPPRLTP